MAQVESSETATCAPFGSVLSLTITVPLGLFLVALPLAYLLIPATILEAPFPPQNQHSETLLFVFAFAVLLPASLVFVPRLADRIAAGPNGEALPSIVALLAVKLAALILLVKISARLPWGDGLAVLLVVTLLWCALSTGLLLRAAASGHSQVLARVSRLTPELLWAAAAVLAIGSGVGFAHLPSVSPLPLIVGLAVAAIVLVLYRHARMPDIGRASGRAIDLGTCVLVFLAVPNLVIFETGTPAGDYLATILQFHQDFFLGPANHVLGGGAMLVDTLSQYGVASIYALTAWFQLAPIGYGTLGLFEGLLSACVFVGAYLILRMAGLPRLLSAAAMLVALVVLVFALIFPLGGLLQHGSLRFGLPMAVLVAAVAEARWPRRVGLSRTAQLVVVGIASIWALEAFAYTLLTVAAIVAMRTWALPSEERRRALVRWIGELLAACVVTHVLFAVITLLASGELPDWSLYLRTLRAFLVGEVGDLTYDFSPWSPGLAVGALYVASVAGIVLLLRRRQELVVGNWPLVMALAGSTAYGVALFSYFVNRSADHILPYICLPTVMIGTLWLGLLLRSTTPVNRRIREGSLAIGLAVSVLLIATAWSGAGTRFSQSALAIAAPGGKPLNGSLDRLWHLPPLSPGTPEGERLLARYIPGQEETPVLTSADLGIEILIRSGRINEIPLSDPWEDSLVPEQHLNALRAAVDELQPGDRILVDDIALDDFTAYRRDPSIDPLAASNSEQTLVPSGLTSLQEWVLHEIARTYTLRTVATGSDGLSVVELVPAEDGEATARLSSPQAPK
jgi:hypothetical protein